MLLILVFFLSKLKKFQQKRTPSSSPTVKKTHKNTTVVPTNLNFTGSDSSAETSTGHENLPVSVSTLVLQDLSNRS